jgi:hypothetical protein
VERLPHTFHPEWRPHSIGDASASPRSLSGCRTFALPPNLLQKYGALSLRKKKLANAS